MARVDTAADRVAELARPDSRMVAGNDPGSEELARAAGAVHSLTGQESPTVANVNAALRNRPAPQTPCACSRKRWKNNRTPSGAASGRRPHLNVIAMNEETQ